MAVQITQVIEKSNSTVNQSNNKAILTNTNNKQEANLFYIKNVIDRIEILIKCLVIIETVYWF